jgi:hypothetical protein
LLTSGSSGSSAGQIDSGTDAATPGLENAARRPRGGGPGAAMVGAVPSTTDSSGGAATGERGQEPSSA